MRTVCVLMALCALIPGFASAGEGPCNDSTFFVAAPDGADPGSWGATDAQGNPAAVTVDVWWTPTAGSSVPLATYTGSIVPSVSMGGIRIPTESLWCSGESGVFGARATASTGESAAATPKPYVFAQAGEPPPPPPPPSPSSVSMRVVGDPATGPWGVEISIDDDRDVMVDVYLNGALHHHENFPLYGFPDADQIVPLTTLGPGTYTIEAIFFLQDTTIEVGNGWITVIEGPTSPPPPPPPPDPVCGDGVIEGAEVCEGLAGCLATELCREDCSGCDPIPAFGVPCMTPLPGVTLECAPYRDGIRCYANGWLDITECSGAPQFPDARTCLQLPGSAGLVCDSSMKCSWRTTAMRIERCP